MAAVIGPSVMAVFILLIACFNFINTFLFMASHRLKEIGIRKVLGGVRRQLIFQHIGEGFLICLASIGVGLLITEFLIPAYNELWPFLKLKLTYHDRDVFLFLGLLLAFISIFSGSYPSFYISKFSPIQILTGKQKFGTTGSLSYILLTLQFAISIIGVVCAIAFYANAKYQQRLDLGYNQEGVIFIPIDGANFKTYKTALQKTENNILSIGGAKDHFNVHPYGIKSPVKSTEDKEAEVFIADISDGYLKTSGVTLLEGRDFIENSESDLKESVIVTENLVKQLDWSNPVGKEVRIGDTTRYFVVGVVKDVFIHGLWDTPDPLIFRYITAEKCRFIVTSALTENIQKTNEYNKSVWKEIFPNQYYKGTINNGDLSTSILVNTNIVKIFLFLGVTALTLAVSGLFTLTSLTVVRKMKEISIRKICGATTYTIARIVSANFAIVLTLASILGIYLASFLSRLLMKSLWKFFLPASMTTFAISMLIVLGVSFFTIWVLIRKAAATNPVDALKEA
jgi:ABC-type lipoprotein release transport system permease subunit